MSLFGPNKQEPHFDLIGIKIALGFIIAIFGFSNNAISNPIPDWKPIKPVQKKPPQPPPIQKPKEKIEPIAQNIAVDESEELLKFDLEFAKNIKSYGPLSAYSNALSENGTLYDAAGGTPMGKQAAEVRFAKFPSNIILVRKPYSALSHGGAGSSWGQYEVMHGANLLAKGQYSSVWRKEEGGWKLVTELAAGIDKAPPPLPTKPIKPIPSDKKEISNNLLRPNDPLKDVLGRKVDGN